MRRSVRWMAWGSYGLAVVLCALYLQFPGKRVGRWLSSEMARRMPVTVTIPELRLLPIFRIGVPQGQLARNGAVVSFRNLLVAPSVLELARGRLAARVGLEVADGRVEGTLFRHSGLFPVSGTVSFDGLLSGALQAFSEKPFPLEVKGAASGTLSIEGDEGVERVALEVVSKEITLSGVVAGLRLEPIAVRNLTLHLARSQGRFDVVEGHAAGGFGVVTLEGSMQIQRNWLQSRLDLKAELKPDPAFLSRMLKATGLGRQLGGTLSLSELPVNITGTLARPLVSVAGFRL